MARRPSVRWNDARQRWMAWVRFPDGSRRITRARERFGACQPATPCYVQRGAGRLGGGGLSEGGGEPQQPTTTGASMRRRCGSSCSRMRGDGGCLTTTSRRCCPRANAHWSGWRATATPTATGSWSTRRPAAAWRTRDGRTQGRRRSAGGKATRHRESGTEAGALVRAACRCRRMRMVWVSTKGSARAAGRAPIPRPTAARCRGGVITGGRTGRDPRARRSEPGRTTGRDCDPSRRTLTRGLSGR